MPGLALSDIFYLSPNTNTVFITFFIFNISFINVLEKLYRITGKIKKN